MRLDFVFMLPVVSYVHGSMENGTNTCVFFRAQHAHDMCCSKLENCSTYNHKCGINCDTELHVDNKMTQFCSLFYAINPIGTDRAMRHDARISLTVGSCQAARYQSCSLKLRFMLKWAESAFYMQPKGIPCYLGNTFSILSYAFQ